MWGLGSCGQFWSFGSDLKSVVGDYLAAERGGESRELRIRNS